MEDQVINHVETQSEEKRYNISLDKDGKKYVFSVPDGTPLGVAYDSCAEILYALSNMIQKATESMIPKEPKPVEVEPVVPEAVDGVVNQAN